MTGDECPFCGDKNRRKCVQWGKVKFSETTASNDGIVLTEKQYEKWRNEPCKDRQIANLTADLTKTQASLDHVIKHKDSEIMSLMDDLAAANESDAQKTREINILVKENRTQAKELADAKERLELWHSFYQAYEPWNYLEGVRAALTPALAKLKAKGEI